MGRANTYLSDALDSLLCARMELKNDPAKWAVVNELMQKIQAIKAVK
jgi:hypothetical protein